MQRTKKLKINYPWLSLPPYGGFFVPTLNVAKTREEGLKEALRHRIDAKAEPAIKDGKFGVLFTVGAMQRGKPWQTQSSPDECRPDSGASLQESCPAQPESSSQAE